MFQNPNDQIFKNTVLDEVMFGPLQIGMSKKQAKEVALKALDMVGLKGVEKINPYELGYRDAFLSPEEFVPIRKRTHNTKGRGYYESILDRIGQCRNRKCTGCRSIW